MVDRVKKKPEIDTDDSVTDDGGFSENEGSNSSGAEDQSDEAVCSAKDLLQAAEVPDTPPFAFQAPEVENQNVEANQSNFSCLRQPDEGQNVREFRQEPTDGLRRHGRRLQHSIHELRLHARELRLNAFQLHLNGLELRLQARHLRLQARHLRLQARHLRLQAHHLRLHARQLRLNARELRMNAHELNQKSCELQKCARKLEQSARKLQSVKGLDIQEYQCAQYRNVQEGEEQQPVDRRNAQNEKQKRVVREQDIQERQRVQLQNVQNQSLVQRQNVRKRPRVPQQYVPRYPRILHHISHYMLVPHRLRSQRQDVKSLRVQEHPNVLRNNIREPPADTQVVGEPPIEEQEAQDLPVEGRDIKRRFF